MNELERTRAEPVWMVGTRTDLNNLIREGNVRAIGRFQPTVEGMHRVPVVYVSKRAKPWYDRPLARVTFWTLGAMLVIAGFLCVGYGLASQGAITAGIILASLTVGMLARTSRRGRSVTVTTTTRVRIK